MKKVLYYAELSVITVIIAAIVAFAYSSMEYGALLKSRFHSNEAGDHF